MAPRLQAARACLGQGESFVAAAWPRCSKRCPEVSRIASFNSARDAAIADAFGGIVTVMPPPVMMEASRENNTGSGHLRSHRVLSARTGRAVRLHHLSQ